MERLLSVAGVRGRKRQQSDEHKRPYQHFSPFFYPSSSISSLCSVSTTASEVTTQLSPAIHLGPWQRLLSVLFPSLSVSPLHSNQTCNYSVGQHAPHWPTVKYDHQFGPYPFIAIPPPSIGAVCFSPPAPLRHHRPFHPPFTSPLSTATRQSVKMRNIARHYLHVMNYFHF